MGKILCRSCELGDYSNHVPGEGDIHCGLFIIGEGPGADEDRTMRPFIGKAGEVLNVALKHSGYERKKSYISNIVKCRPPDNRKPTRREIMACTDKFLEDEIKKGNPKVIVALGAVAISYFTGSKNVGQSREKKFVRLVERDFIVIPTWHPSYILRSGKKKKDIMELIKDLKRAKKYLEVYKKF